jgi:3-hydroxybutyryl-CoA dehydrogenase
MESFFSTAASGIKRKLMTTADQHNIGVVGLGLMGCSIVSALLIAGHKVVAMAPIAADMEGGPERIRHFLELSYAKQIANSPPGQLEEQLSYADNYNALQGCFLVLECVSEKLSIKQMVLDFIEKNVPPTCIIATNTSAIPITILQENLQYPQRFMGMHWAEPAFTTRFLEIICGPKTDLAIAQQLYKTATGWGKEPTLLLKDIRGFITNRLMYAMYREGFYLVENGYATIEDIDRACRNDAGHWMTFCGLFRYMDLTGIQAYYTVMKDLFPTLSNETTMPALMEQVAGAGDNGITSKKGFYSYTKEEAAEWEKAYEEFAFDISKLSARYPINLVEKRLSEKAIESINNTT